MLASSGRRRSVRHSRRVSRRQLRAAVRGHYNPWLLVGACPSLRSRLSQAPGFGQGREACGRGYWEIGATPPEGSSTHCMAGVMGVCSTATVTDGCPSRETVLTCGPTTALGRERGRDTLACIYRRTIILYFVIAIAVCGKRSQASPSIDLLGWIGGTGNSRISQAFAINNLGQVAGETSINNNARRAFRYTDGVGMINLGNTIPGSPNNLVGQSINVHGDVVGYSSAFGFRYKDGVGMIPF